LGVRFSSIQSISSQAKTQKSERVETEGDARAHLSGGALGMAALFVGTAIGGRLALGGGAVITRPAFSTS
jgi:hypothetical protein